MERYCLVRFRAGRGLASDMGLKFKVTDTQGDTIELHHDRLGYRFADRSKLEPWVEGATWDGTKYIDLVDRDTVTLRDRFAMSFLPVLNMSQVSSVTDQHLAERLYQLADTMLAARRTPSDVTG